MAQKLFILGLPGSGKSTIACHIVDYFKRNHKEWSSIRLSDYDILYSMFQEDQTQKNFYPTEHNGFYVKTPFMYDKALMQLEMEIASYDYAENTLIVIEFARSDYVHALANFSPAFLQDAYFLFLDADVETGMKRVRDRMKHPNPRSRDDHFVSKITFEFYRQKDNAKYLSEVAKRITNEHSINPKKIKIMNNNKGPKKEFWDSIHAFVESIMESIFTLV